MIRTLQEPLERLQAAHGAGEVLRFVPHAGYAGSFGYEWTRYQRTYSDTTLATTVSRRRLEYVLGFPLRFLEGKTVLEVGAGAGRFTEHLVKHAHQVVAVDLSEAILVNGALGTPNLVALQASLYEMPQLSEPVDVVFCRGVIQHTPDPARTIRTLFDLVRPGGLVIFDVYRRTGTEWRTFKYFWRPVVQRLWDVRAFDRVLQRHGTRLYAMHHRVHRLMNRFRLLRRVFGKTPLYWHMNYDLQYPQMNHGQRLEVFKNELVDMFYAHYDQPMTAGEILRVLGAHGQVPYSYDTERNIFRCVRTVGERPVSLAFTKNGVASL